MVDEESPPQISTVLSDVDGTLFGFGTNRRLSCRNLDAMRRAIDAGVHVGLATGRIPGDWSDAIHDALPGLGASVYANGALVIGAAGELIAESKLPADAARSICEYTSGGRAGGGARLAVLMATRCESGLVKYLELAPEGPTFCTELIRNAGEPATLVSKFPLDSPVFKFVIFTKENDTEWARVSDVVHGLHAALGGLADVLECSARQCEILPRGVNKGQGVETLLGHIGASPATTLVLGDAENDVEMLRLAAIGAACCPPARPHTCMHAHMHAHIHACTHACMHTCMHTRPPARTHARTHARMHAPVCRRWAMARQQPRPPLMSSCRRTMTTASRTPSCATCSTSDTCPTEMGIDRPGQS